MQSPRSGTSQSKTPDLAHSSSSVETDSYFADGASTDSSHASAISPRSPRPVVVSLSPPIPRSVSGGIPSSNLQSISPSRAEFSSPTPGSPAYQASLKRRGARKLQISATSSTSGAADEDAADGHDSNALSPPISPQPERLSPKARTAHTPDGSSSKDPNGPRSPTSHSDTTEIGSNNAAVNEFDNIEAFEDRSRWLARLQLEHPAVQDVRQRVRPFARTLAFARSFDVKPQFPPEDILTGAMPPEKRPFAEIVMGLVMQHLHAVGLHKTVASIHQELDRLTARPSDHMEEYFIEDALQDSKLDNTPDSAGNDPSSHSARKSSRNAKDESRGERDSKTSSNSKTTSNVPGNEKSRSKDVRGDVDAIHGRPTRPSTGGVTRAHGGSTQGGPRGGTRNEDGSIPSGKSWTVNGPGVGSNNGLNTSGSLRTTRSPFADLAEHFANTTFRKDQAFFERDLRESPLVTMIRSAMIRAQEVYDLAMADRPATRTLPEAQLEEKLYALGMLEDEDDIADDVDIWEEGHDPEENLNAPQSAHSYAAPPPAYGSNVQPPNLARPGSGRHSPFTNSGSGASGSNAGPNGINMAPSSPSIPGSSGISITGASGHNVSHSAGTPIIAPIAASLPSHSSGALTDRSDRSERASILLGIAPPSTARGGDYSSTGSPIDPSANKDTSSSLAKSTLTSRRISSPSSSAGRAKLTSPSTPTTSSLLGAGASDKTTIGTGFAPPSAASQPPSHLVGRLSGGGAITSPPVDDSIRGRKLIYDYWVDVEEGEERPIRAATLNKLVEIATSSKLANLQYTPTFLMTYKSFTTPKKLFEKLKQRWNVPQKAADEQEMTLEQYANPIRLRWIAFLKKWLGEYPEDIDRSLLNDMRRFTFVMMEEPGMRALTNSVVAILDKLSAQLEARHASASSSAYQTTSVIGGHGFSFQSLIGQSVSPYAYASALVFSERAHYTATTPSSSLVGAGTGGASVSTPGTSGVSSLTSSSLIPSAASNAGSAATASSGATTVLMSIRGPSGIMQSATSPVRKVSIPAGSPPIPKVPKNIFHPTLSLYQIDQEEVARQLTLMDSHIFMAIKPSELLNQSWGKPKLKHLAPNVLRMVALSNQLAHSISTHILQGQKPKDRAKIIEWWIRVAEHLKNLSNYHGVMAVISGINSGPTVRLKYSRREVSKALLDQLMAYEKIFESDSSFVNYRATLTASVPPVIPYLGIHQTDLTFIEEGNKDMHGHLINFAKRRLIYQTIAAIQNYQQTGYNLQPVRQIQDLIANMKPADTKELFKVSLLREPRESSR